MIPATLTFSGTYLELVSWALVGLLYLALAFAAGWFAHAWKREAGK